MVDTRFEDGRAQRRDLTGIWTGSAAGALVALVLTFLLPLSGSPRATALGMLIGALAGAWLGRLVIRRVSADDWEPLNSQRSYVGARAPDAET
jgi:membrane protein implicated in regulation of membrane protease activity